ncbi:hypothetical protein GCM10018793_57020 [Streptomyces sulfonofaciens]|uniref:DUF309 domain-containing protein n=1 Tax=Streptomyces sulfonofaciens TaxID=68272 RepID=A0A919GM29_9ACTN|nr:DUF309 domain-containing protein [Streptomyces sulfonofaciens]GHH86160.1 hypothetical protein GCM10018793_57020 [Streptomyces sulfonofaciens]
MGRMDDDEGESGTGRPAGPDRDRDRDGRARNARPRDGLGRPLRYGAQGTARQPEGISRSPTATIDEAQLLLDEGKPFHAHEVFEDAWKSGPAAERALWRALAQLAVGLTHAARGNAKGGARLLRRGAEAAGDWCSTAARLQPYGLDVPGLTVWARELADAVDEDGSPVDAAAWAPRLRGGGPG